jgi:hypothetical protein
VSPHGTTVLVDYGNISAPAILIATLDGPAVFADGGQALTTTISAADGSYTLHLRPTAGATRGEVFTLQVALTGLLLEHVGTIAGDLYLPVLLKGF